MISLVKKILNAKISWHRYGGTFCLPSAWKVETDVQGLPHLYTQYEGSMADIRPCFKRRMISQKIDRLCFWIPLFRQCYQADTENWIQRKICVSWPCKFSMSPNIIYSMYCGYCTWEMCHLIFGHTNCVILCSYNKSGIIFLDYF